MTGLLDKLREGDRICVVTRDDQLVAENILAAATVLIAMRELGFDRPDAYFINRDEKWVQNHPEMNAVVLDPVLGLSLQNVWEDIGKNIVPARIKSEFEERFVEPMSKDAGMTEYGHMLEAMTPCWNEGESLKMAMMNSMSIAARGIAERAEMCDAPEQEEKDLTDLVSLDEERVKSTRENAVADAKFVVRMAVADALDHNSKEIQTDKAIEITLQLDRDIPRREVEEALKEYNALSKATGDRSLEDKTEHGIGFTYPDITSRDGNQVPVAVFKAIGEWQFPNADTISELTGVDLTFASADGKTLGFDDQGDVAFTVEKIIRDGTVLEEARERAAEIEATRTDREVEEVVIAEDEQLQEEHEYDEVSL